MGAGEVEWAGVRFTPLYHHDGRFFRGPGLFAFVHCDLAGERTLLFVDHTDNIAAAMTAHPFWPDALRLGFNELNVNLQAQARIDRLILRERIVRRCEPMLNVLHPCERETRTTVEPLKAATPHGAALRALPSSSIRFG